MATNKNFEVKNGLTIAGTERITSAGVGTFTDLNVTGTTTTIDTANLQVKDKNIVLNYGTGDTSSTANGSGITIQDAVNSSTDATINWDNSNGEFDFSHPINVTGGITSSANLSIGGTTTLTGNVGIETASPNGKLQFASNVNTRKIVLWEGANNNYQFYGFGVEANTLVYSTYEATDDHVFFSGANTTSRNELMRIKGSGNVGIGTTSPTSKISVVGGASNAGISIKSGGNAGVDPFRVTWTGGTEGDMFVVDDSGNVGIGAIGSSTATATPTELNLGSKYADSAGSAAKAKLKIYEDNSGYVYGLGISSGTFETHLSYPTGKYDWYIGTNRKMRITHDGIIDLKTNNTGALAVPNGTTAQRPTAATGMIRYNTTDSVLEGYIDSSWQPIRAGIPSLTTISGLDLWMDVTGGISSTTIADLSGNNRTGTATSTTNKGTVGSNTYMLCNSGNYIEYANGKIPNYSAHVTYFFVSTNVPTLSGHQTYLGQMSNSTGYQIIRTDAGVNEWQFYFTSQQNIQAQPTNTAHNVNSTVGNSTQIHIFSFGAQADGNLTVYKRTGGTNTSDVFPNNTFPNGNSIHSWVANGNATRLGNSSWADEFFGGGIFAWGIIDHPITSTELGVIYDYYTNKGLGN